MSACPQGSGNFGKKVAYLRMYRRKKYSPAKVNISEAPEKANAHGYLADSWRQGSLRLSEAPPRMCTKPVAKTTPPAKQDPKKKVVSACTSDFNSFQEEIFLCCGTVSRKVTYLRMCRRKKYSPAKVIRTEAPEMANAHGNVVES